MSHLKKEITATKTVINVSEVKKISLSAWRRMFLNRFLVVGSMHF